MANRIKGAGGLKAIGVVHGYRPERPHGRELVPVEVKQVVVLAIQRLPIGIGDGERAHRILRLVRAQSNHRDDRTLEVRIAVDAGGVGDHLPAVDGSAQPRQRLGILAGAAADAPSNAPRIAGSRVLYWKRSPGFSPMWRDRSTIDRRSRAAGEVQQLGRKLEVVFGGHGVDLFQRRVVSGSRSTCCIPVVC
jgi:hypothetical protein